MDPLLAAIVEDDRTRVKQLLRADAALATGLIETAKLYGSGIAHWIYVGDTALHLAAAGYRVEIVGLLLAAGADPNAATNHRQSGPLHYAADGYINGPIVLAYNNVDALGKFIDALRPGTAAKNAGNLQQLDRATRTISTPEGDFHQTALLAVEGRLRAAGLPPT